MFFLKIDTHLWIQKTKDLVWSLFGHFKASNETFTKSYYGLSRVQGCIKYMNHAYLQQWASEHFPAVIAHFKWQCPTAFNSIKTFQKWESEKIKSQIRKKGRVWDAKRGKIAKLNFGSINVLGLHWKSS